MGVLQGLRLRSISRSRLGWATHPIQGECDLNPCSAWLSHTGSRWALDNPSATLTRGANLELVAKALALAELRGWSLPGVTRDGVAYLKGANESDVSYPDSGFAVLGHEGGSGFWFEHRAEAVIEIIHELEVKTLLEVGSGTGAMAMRLGRALEDVVAVEPLASGAEAAARLGVASICGHLSALELPDATIEAVGMFDVLEHVQDVDGLVGEVRRVLIPGGLLLVTVPALPYLWAEEDDVAGHKRRYTRRSLGITMDVGGLTQLRSEHLFASLVPVALLSRALPYKFGRRLGETETLSRMQSQLNPHPLVDRMASRILAREKSFSRRLPPPFGTSIVGVFRKVA